MTGVQTCALPIYRLGSNQDVCDRAELKSKERTRLRLFNLYLSQGRLPFTGGSGQTAGHTAGTRPAELLERAGATTSLHRRLPFAPLLCGERVLPATETLLQHLTADELAHVESQLQGRNSPASLSRITGPNSAIIQANRTRDSPLVQGTFNSGSTSRLNRKS